MNSKMYTVEEYLKSLKLYNYPKHVVSSKCDGDLKDCHLIFQMGDLLYNHRIGRQLRYCNPEYQKIKSKTEYGSKIGYFYDHQRLNKTLPVVVLEGEKDWLTGWNLGLNCVGLQGVHNLNKLVNTLSCLGFKRVLLLVDQDEAADRAISKIEKRDICYDIRGVLGEYKDLSDAYVAGKNIGYYYKEATKQNNLLTKLGEYTYTRKRMPKNPSIDLNDIPVDVVLEDLYPVYSVKGDRIYESGKMLSGYRFWKSKNIIKDFSEKDRPEGNAWKIAYKYYGDKKEAYNYLKKYL